MNRRPLNPITQADIAQFEEDGVICLRGMFDQDSQVRHFLDVTP